MSEDRERRIASHPDDPDAPLADRLLLALGMWPSYVEQLGVDAVLDAAVGFRTKAHLFPMAAEDYGTVADERDEAEAQVARYREALVKIRTRGAARMGGWSRGVADAALATLPPTEGAGA